MLKKKLESEAVLNSQSSIDLSDISAQPVVTEQVREEESSNDTFGAKPDIEEPIGQEDPQLRKNSFYERSAAHTRFNTPSEKSP